MKLNKINFLEQFVLVTFPLALVVGCTTTAEHSSMSGLEGDTVMAHKYPLGQTNHQLTSEKLPKDESNDVLIDESIQVSDDIDGNSDNNNQGGDMLVNTAVTEMRSEADMNTISIAMTDDAANDNASEVELEVSTSNDTNLIEVNIPVAPISSIPTQGIFFFEVNKYEVSPSDMAMLKQHASYLKQNPEMVLYVDGFSDSRGPASVNYQLSKNRAQQVAQLLIRFGAPESRIKVNGYGESFPLTRESNWDENRRVELEYANMISADELYAGLK